MLLSIDISHRGKNIMSKITKQRINHGTISTPFAKYHTHIDNLLPFYPVHWHEEAEIIRIVDGSGKVCVGGIWQQLDKGDILLIPPFVLHTINTQLHQHMQIDTVVFNLRLLDTGSNDMCNLRYFAPMLASVGNCPIIIRTNMPVNNSISASLDTICLTIDDGASYQLAVKANLYWIFYHLYNNKIVTEQTSNDTISADDKKIYTIKKILQHIHAHYTSTIAIEDIAKQSGYSPFYIMKMFKQFTGDSIVDYINRLRLDVAGIELLTTDTDISAIAVSVGYNNISYFNRQFLAQYNTTPKKFRTEYMLID